MKKKGLKINVREVVVEILTEVLDNGNYSHLVLREVMEKYIYLPRQDRAFINRTAVGTMERLTTIDFCLGQYSRTAVPKMKPLIRNLLRESVYEILYLSGTPDHAIVNEAVSLAGKRGFSGLKGYVNGVLRTIIRARDAEQIPWPEDVAGHELAYLSIRYSMPEWILKIWMNEYPREKLEKMLEAFLTPSSVTIRLNRHTDREVLRSRLEEKGITIDPTPLDNVWGIHGFDRLSRIPGLSSGEFQIQDLSSVLVGNRVNETAGVCGEYGSCLDVCAAPGGKSLHMADIGYQVTSCDLSEQKVELINENIRRASVNNRDIAIRTMVQDARIFRPEWKEQYDVVIADLPCSGLGVLGRKPDLKYHSSPEMLAELPGLQKEILSNASQYVRPGGLLVYSTCTIRRAENEDQIDSFLKETGEPSGFSLVTQEQLLPGEWPGDGFFIALMRKSGNGH